MMKYKKYSVLVLMVFSIAFFCGCSQEVKDNRGIDHIQDTLPWSERMALSIMKSNPEPWMIEFMDRPVWSYPQGTVLYGFEQLWKVTGKDIYLDYIKEYVDLMVNEDGSINTFRMETFNIDLINPGKILFNLYDTYGDEKYLKAIELLRYQIDWQPRTTEGGFWHKLRYPWQMWLDGAYMGTPFMVMYGNLKNQPEWLDDAVYQLVLMEQKTRDPETGLLYHGWDESRVQPWADPETGLSSNFWGRAMGWYAMALVDVLELLPKDHQGYEQVAGILERLAVAVIQVQDEETGLWYQVLDQGDREGNYLEASVSAMFVYALAKGVNQGVLDATFLQYAGNGFDGILENFIEVAPDGELFLHEICAVAGLGGSDRRDGSFEYYISESKRTNDPKGTAPFLKAAIELKR